MKFVRSARTDKKEAQAQPPTSPLRSTERAGVEAGFTLLEMVCAVALLALLASILLPRVPRATSQPRLQGYAVEVASLLKADRSAALVRRSAVSAVIDAPRRRISAGSSGHVVLVPDDVGFEAILPETCNGRRARSTVSFFANGMSCGGAIRLTRLGTGFEIRVNWLTGGIDIVGHTL
jgi:general secretion pathway protein H